MSPLHHREPGLVGATFLHRPYASIIADGIHTSFAAIKLAKLIMGDRLFLITDAVTESKGAYEFREAGAEGSRFYADAMGVLAGSALT